MMNNVEGVVRGPMKMFQAGKKLRRNDQNGQPELLR
jgi:hypothetical protein